MDSVVGTSSVIDSDRRTTVGRFNKTDIVMIVFYIYYTRCLHSTYTLKFTRVSVEFFSIVFLF